MPSLPDRPRALTPEVQKKIVDAVRAGSYFRPACVAAGITLEAVGYWRKLYESGAKHAQIYADFFTSLAKASSEVEIETLADVRSGRPGWQGPAWFLERRYPRRWGKDQRPDDGADRARQDIATLREHIDSLRPKTKAKPKPKPGPKPRGPG